MNPREFREVGHRVVDLLAEYLEHIEEKPVFPNVEPSKLTRLFDEALPRHPGSPDTVLAELEEKLLPYCTHVGHPGYMGLITPSPSPIGIYRGFHLLCSQPKHRGLYDRPFGRGHGATNILSSKQQVRLLQCQESSLK